METRSEFSQGKRPGRPLSRPQIEAKQISSYESGARRRCIYSQARGCRWTSPRARQPGCMTRSGSPWSRRWAPRRWKWFEASLLEAILPNRWPAITVVHLFFKFNPCLPTYRNGLLNCQLFILGSYFFKLRCCLLD